MVPILLAAMLSACASTNGEGEDDFDDGADLFGYEEPSDPLEPFNRAVFFFNDTVDGMILRPLAEAYDLVLPSVAKDAVRNFGRHISTPVVLVNDLLQWDLERAETTAARMVINTAVLGLGDIAPERYPYHSADFGQTLAIYGVDDGFYLVLPIFGPSSLRDGFGMGVDTFLHPLTYVDGTTTFRISTSAASGIDLRARNLDTLDELERDSVDFYARLRSLYYQRRQAEIDKRSADEEGFEGGF